MRSGNITLRSSSTQLNPSSILLLVFVLILTPVAVASSTWYVNGTKGNDRNDCKSPQTACKTIGNAISLASSGDTIMVAPASYPETLTIGISLTIIGSGNSTGTVTTTAIDGYGKFDTVVTIPNADTNVTISKMIIRNGDVAYVGGGISNSGTLTVNDSIITGNTTYTDGWETSYGGGGVYNNGTLTINNSSVTDNVAWPDRHTWEYGGGISNFGMLTINNSTISGNVGQDCDDCDQTSYGGGIYNGGTLTISNSTISANHASYGGGIDNAGTLMLNNVTLSGNDGRWLGGAIEGTAILQNSIVANSTSSGNCDGTVTSNGYNLSSDGSCTFNNIGDLNNTDPLLDVLHNNGGPTQTMRLLSGSPAIDAGNPHGCTDDQGHPLKTDQRGLDRPGRWDTGACDIGAFEKQTD